MPHAKSLIRGSLASARETIKAALADIKPEEMSYEAGTRSIESLLGEAAVALREVLIVIGHEDLPEVPGGFEARYARWGTGSETSDSFFDLISIFWAHLDVVSKTLLIFQSEHLDEAVNIPGYFDEDALFSYTTVGTMFVAVSGFIHYLAGEMSTIRLKLGKSPMPDVLNIYEYDQNDPVRSEYLHEQGSMVNKPSREIATGINTDGMSTLSEVIRSFERFASTVHELWDGTPEECRATGEQLGLSTAWIVGHLALLIESVLTSFGGEPSAKLRADFVATYGPGRDGSEIRDDPSVLIAAFDHHIDRLNAFLRSADISVLGEKPRCDDFGLRVLMPHDSLRGHASAALYYANMYILELATLCHFFEQ